HVLPPSELSPLSLHDALPILRRAASVLPGNAVSDNRERLFHDESPLSSRRRRADRYHPAGRPEDAAPGKDLGLLLVHGRGRGRGGRSHASPSARAHRLKHERGRPRAGPSCFSTYPPCRSGSWPLGRLPGPPAGSNLQGSWRPSRSTAAPSMPTPNKRSSKRPAPQGSRTSPPCAGIPSCP